MGREGIRSIGISILGGNSGISGHYELGIDSIRVVNEEDVIRTSPGQLIRHAMVLEFLMKHICRGENADTGTPQY